MSMMSEFDAGKIKFDWRGDWTATPAYPYEADDVTAHAGSLWIGTAPAPGEEPGTAGSGWDRWLPGLPNLEQPGDMVMRGADGPVRLPAGASGRTLRINAGGLPAWAAPETRMGTGVKALPHVPQGGVPGVTSACLNDLGEVLAWGRGEYLGNGSISAGNAYTPLLVGISGARPEGGFVRLFMLPDMLFAIDAAGNCWSAGRNNNGQLGHGDTVSRPCLTRIEFFAQRKIRIREVVSPQNWYYTGTSTASYWSAYCSAYFLTEDGLVFTCGYNVEGQLGLGDVAARSTPALVDGLEGVAQLAVGACSSGSVYARTESGRLYVWGCNTSSQLGLGDAANKTLPQAVSTLAGVMDVAAGYNHALCVTAEGRLYGAGTNNLGQLGLGAAASAANWTPPNLPVTPARVYCCGQSGGGAASYVIDTGGILWAAGANAGGQLGLGHANNATVFTRVDASAPWQGKIAKFRCLATDTYQGAAVILDAEGRLWAAGANNYGVLARGNNARAAVNNAFALMCHGLGPNVRFTDMLLSGCSDSHHALALTDDGRLLSCGSNGYGQLGSHAGNLQTHQDLLCVVRT